MRLFVAVELPGAVVAAAAAVSHGVRERAHRLAPNARLTWIPPDRMHLTLRFLGDVDGPHVSTLVTALSDPFDAAPMTVTLGAPGAFPARGAPRVLWVGFSEGVADLANLERQVSLRLERVGFPPEERPYSPHLTLARVRDPRGLRLPVLFDGIGVPEATGTIDAITLFESRLSPKGPTYTALHRTPLTRV